MEFLKRPLAITDVETTGFDADIHEIIEIGLVLVDQQTLKIKDEWSIKVKPRHLRTAAEKALKVAGYNKLDWLDAVTLKEAMEIYSKKTKNAIFVAQNSFFDWSFLSQAFKETGVEDHLDYHRVDLFTLGWSKHKKLKGLSKFTPLLPDIKKRLFTEQRNFQDIKFNEKSSKGVTGFTLKEMCEHFEIEPEPMPHRAPNGAKKAYEVLKRLQNL